MNKTNYKILLTGGGTGGSVSPLLAIAEELRKDKEENFEFLWLGGQNGPEEGMVAAAKIKYKAIYNGKLRRYWSWQNFLDMAKIKIGFFQSFFTMLSWRPDLVLCAGSFVGVPVVWAAWILRVPTIIHQQDAVTGLANKLMAPFARVVTVTFRNSLQDFGQKAIWTGNPMRLDIEYTAEFASEQTNNQSSFKKKNLPLLLVVGGGTGAVAINDLVKNSVTELTKFCQIIHLTGKDKGLDIKDENYWQFEFLDATGMSQVYRLADLVVTRAGMGVLTELAYLKKPAIIIPMPDSHQETNAEVFKDNLAAIVLEQYEITPGKFCQTIKNLFINNEERQVLIENISKVMKDGANAEIAKIIFQIIK